jgi:hypothetical protein
LKLVKFINEGNPNQSTTQMIMFFKLQSQYKKNKPFKIKNNGMKRVKTDKIEIFWSQKRQNIGDKVTIIRTMFKLYIAY